MTLRPATDADSFYFYTLRIDPVASRMSRRRPPTWEEHTYWWEHTSDLRYVYMFNRVPVGTIRVGADGAVSIIVDPLHRGKGHGPQMLEQVLPLAKAAGLTTLLAEIAPENVQSQQAFTKAGWSPILFERSL